MATRRDRAPTSVIGKNTRALDEGGLYFAMSAGRPQRSAGACCARSTIVQGGRHRRLATLFAKESKGQSKTPDEIHALTGCAY